MKEFPDDPKLNINWKKIRVFFRRLFFGWCFVNVALSLVAVLLGGGSEHMTSLMVWAILGSLPLYLEYGRFRIRSLLLRRQLHLSNLLQCLIKAQLNLQRLLIAMRFWLCLFAFVHIPAPYTASGHGVW